MRRFLANPSCTAYELLPLLRALLCLCAKLIHGATREAEVSEFTTTSGRARSSRSFQCSVAPIPSRTPRKEPEKFFSCDAGLATCCRYDDIATGEAAGFRSFAQAAPSCSQGFSNLG